MTTTEHPQLAAAHLQQLRASAISDAIIAERGYRSIPPRAAALVRQLAGVTFSERLLRTVLHQGALGLPVYRLGDAQPALWMLRPDQPRVDARGHAVKYEWPRSQPNVLDTLPRYRAQLGNPAVRLCLVEGIKKTDAVATAYGDQLVPVTMNGVFGWRGRNAQGGTTASADLECIAWHGRTVWLFPDGDVRFNPHVLQAIERLTRLLSSRYGVAEVLVLQLPMRPDEPKVGVDDFLAAGHTTHELEAHLSRIAAVSRAARVPMGIHSRDAFTPVPAGRVHGAGPDDLPAGCARPGPADLHRRYVRPRGRRRSRDSGAQRNTGLERPRRYPWRGNRPDCRAQRPARVQPARRRRRRRDWPAKHQRDHAISG
jgi:hypothetical protein